MKGTLERMTNLATILACMVVVGHVGIAQYRAFANRPVPLYSAGDVIADTGELSLQSARLTLLVGTASTCHFCTESMDYYGRLTRTAHQNGVRIVAVTD